MSTLNFIPSSYPPSHAEHGKFVQIDRTTLTNYPSTGRGRYAILTTEVQPTFTFTPNLTAAYLPQQAEHGKFVALSGESITDYPYLSGRGKYAVLTYKVNDILTPIFSASYSPAEAEHGKFCRLDMSTETSYVDVSGQGKFAILTYEIDDTAVDAFLTSGYPPSHAEHGKFVKLDTSTITNYPSTGRGKYAMLVNVADTITADLDWARSYPPSHSEHGKLGQNDMSTITNYPSTGRGRYSILTVNVSGESSGEEEATILSHPTLTDDLIWYYNFDNTFEDQTANNHDGTSTAAFGTGILNQSVSGDGQLGSIVSITDDPDFDLGTSDFSISFWLAPDFNINASSGVHFVVWKGSGSNIFTVQFNDDSIRLTLQLGVPSQTINSGALGWTAGEWHHVTFSRVGILSSYVYIDGVDNTNVATGSQLINLDSLTGNFSFLTPPAPFNSFAFEGQMDEFGFWSRALTQSEIEDLYNSGSGLPYS